MALLPIDIDMLEWAQQLRGEYSTVDIPALYDINIWKEWANYIRNSDGFNDKNIPMPNDFDSFREWAQNFTQSIGA